MAPVLSVAEAVNHPHLRERRTVRTVEDRHLGAFDIPGMPLRFSEFPDELTLEAPILGEHNRALLEEIGLSAEAIEDLERRGVLARDPEA